MYDLSLPTDIKGLKCFSVRFRYCIDVKYLIVRKDFASGKLLKLRTAVNLNTQHYFPQNKFLKLNTNISFSRGNFSDFSWPAAHLFF